MTYERDVVMIGSAPTGTRLPQLVASDFVLAYGFQDGAPAPELRWANAGMRAILGYGASALAPGWLLDSVLPDDQQMVITRHLEALRGSPSSLEAHFRAADGSVRILRGELRPADGDDPAGGGVALWIDATAEHAVREAAKQRGEELWRARRVAIVAELAGSIAHECANLLTAIRAGCELLAADLGESSHREDIAAIVRSADSATALTRQLQSIGQTRTSQPRLIALDDLVAGFERVLLRLLGESFPLRVDPGHAGFIHADASAIEHVILDLVLRARDAVPGGTRIALATERMVLEQAESGAEREIPAGVYAAVTMVVPDGVYELGLVQHAGGFARSLRHEDGRMLQLLFPSCVVSSEPLRSPGGRLRGRRRGARPDSSGGTAA